MSTDRDVTRIVRSWLHEDAYEDADRILDAVLHEIDTIPQRRASRLARRFPPMNNNLVRVALVAAIAVVLVAFLGIRFLPWATIAGPTATPEPTPSPQLLLPADLHRQLNARTYRVAGTFAVPFTITLPREWYLSTLEEGSVQFTAGAGLGHKDAYVGVDVIENVFDFPCQSDGRPMNPPVRPTVDGFVEALTHVVNFTAGPVSDVRLGGHDGRAFELTSATDSACEQDLQLWTVRGGGIGGYLSFIGATMQIWVIDVGGTIVVIDAESLPITTDFVKAETQGIVESIRFE